MGRYAFALSEIKEKFDISDKALNQSLYRLKPKKRIAQIRKGFYAIITPEYSSYGMLPAHLFIDDMMKSLNRKYYVGLISAAALYGAAHQQPMEYFVITEKPALRDIKNKKLKINFYVKKEWVNEDVIQKKTDAGYINVSSPELTALDLLFYINGIGLNRTTTILKELSSEIKASELSKAAKRYPQTAAIQRLGYLLDRELHHEKFAEALLNSLKDRKLYPVFLSNNNKGKIEASVENEWKIIKNVYVETDI